MAPRPPALRAFLLRARLPGGEERAVVLAHGEEDARRRAAEWAVEWTGDRENGRRWLDPRESTIAVLPAPGAAAGVVACGLVED